MIDETARYLHERTCANCGRIFCATPYWVYKIRDKIFCSWSCIQAYRQVRYVPKKEPIEKRTISEDEMYSQQSGWSFGRDGSKHRIYIWHGREYNLRQLAKAMGVCEMTARRRVQGKRRLDDY